MILYIIRQKNQLLFALHKDNRVCPIRTSDEVLVLGAEPVPSLKVELKQFGLGEKQQNPRQNQSNLVQPGSGKGKTSQGKVKNIKMESSLSSW